MEILIQDSHNESRELFFGMGEVFNFLTKFLNFKGASARNESRNLKKIKIFKFLGMIIGDIIIHDSQDERRE